MLEGKLGPNPKQFQDNISAYVEKTQQLYNWSNLLNNTYIRSIHYITYVYKYVHTYVSNKHKDLHKYTLVTILTLHIWKVYVHISVSDSY